MIITQTYAFPDFEDWGAGPVKRVPGPAHVSFRHGAPSACNSCGHPKCAATRLVKSCTCIKWAGDNLVRFLDDGRKVMMPLPVGSTVIEADGHCWIRTEDEGWVPGIPEDSEVWHAR